MEMFWRIYKISDLPVVVMDNFYDTHEVKKIFNELFFLARSPEKMHTESELGSAKDSEGKNLKKTKGFWLDTYFFNREYSDILELNRKIFNNVITKELIKNHIVFKYIKTCNLDTTLIQYYENEDKYEMHDDNAIFSLVTTFYQNPKKFKGGEFQFFDGTKIECVSNRAIIFPSILPHRVLPIQMEKNDMNKNLGRFSITQFMKVA